MQRVTLKTSTIFISKGERTRVYRSVGEIPQGLRQELEASTNGFNSATILIADRRGREEVRRALKGMPSALRNRFAPSLAPETTLTEASPAALPEPEEAIVPEVSLLGRLWVRLTIASAVALASWAIYSLR
jgi:hypothetical protein